MVSYKARFTNVNDPYMRYLIVCVDKTWGQSGCRPWTGDWVQVVWLSPGQYIDSPYFTPKTVLTAVTSSDAGYYYRVDIIDENGNVVYTCGHVDRNTPCYFYPSTSTTTTVSSVTLLGVSPTVSPTTPTTTPTCPAVGYYGVISAQPVTSVWTVGQPLQIVLNMCSPSPPSQNIPIDVIATAFVCNKEFFFGDLGFLGTYPANQQYAKVTITIPPLLVPQMCLSGTYSGTLRLDLSVEDPRGVSGLSVEVPLTFVFPSTTTTTSVPTTTTKIVTSTWTTTYQTVPIITVTTSPTTTLTTTTTIMPTQTMTQTTTETTMPAPTTPPLAAAPTPTPVTPAPPSKAGIYIAIGAVAIIALAGLGYWLYSRRKK
jgi:hypothetical protein